MMGKIYSEAELVVAWLGTATKYTAQWVRALNSTPAWQNDHRGRFERWCEVYFPAIMDLYDSPYWSRVWIVQEYTLARRVIIQCGVYKISDENLDSYFGEAIINGSFTVKKRPYFINTFARNVVNSRRRHHRFKEFRNFGSMIKTFMDSECMDPRDRVYGLLAICDPNELARFSITPDYSKSVLELCSQLIHVFKHHEPYSGWGPFYTADVLKRVLRIGEHELDGLSM
jgi:hypothetical protein